MYRVERAASGMSAHDRQLLRHEKTRPILATIWNELLQNEAVAQGMLRQAINYVLKAREMLNSREALPFDGVAIWIPPKF